jgi:PAS domain S-box-containing protein
MSDERIVRSPAQLKAELAQRHAELLADAEFTRGVLANSSDAIAVLDLDAFIAFASAGALRAVGMDDDAVVGMPWLALWRADAQTQAAAAIADAKAGRTAVFEGARRDHNGKSGWWEVSVSPISGTDGRPARLLAIARDVTERKLAQQSQQVMMHELHHRVKNTLATVMAITSQSLARAGSIAEGRLAVEQRLMALAEAHDLLCAGGGDDASLRELVDRAISPYETVPKRISVTGDDVRLSSQGAIAFAMGMHELATNAVKHGALSVKGGGVDVAWQVAAGRLRLSWREHGGPPVPAPARRGFGLRVIEASFRDQLRGSAAFGFAPSGFACEIEVPLARLSAPRREAALGADAS